MNSNVAMLNHHEALCDTTWSFDAQTPLRKVALNLARRVANSTCPVLILGPTGVGKEVLATDIHRHSQRHQGPFVSVNCAAIAPNLFESAFFGHTRGSFTGAMNDKPGFVELAHKGTLFLDEVGDLPVEVQAKLLRFLADGSYWPVGGTTERRADVRLISATHQNIESTAQNTFRRDLFFRLSVVLVRIPALETKDVEAIATSLARETMARHERSLTLTVMNRLIKSCSERSWPGGARELRNAIERFMVLYDANAEVEEQIEEVFGTDSVGAESGVRVKGGNATVAKDFDNLVFLGIARECADVRELAERTDRTLQSAYVRLKKLGLGAHDVGGTAALEAAIDELRRRLEPELPWIQALLKG